VCERDRKREIVRERGHIQSPLLSRHLQTLSSEWPVVSRERMTHNSSLMRPPGSIMQQTLAQIYP